MPSEPPNVAFAVVRSIGTSRSRALVAAGQLAAARRLTGTKLPGLCDVNWVALRRAQYREAVTGARKRRLEIARAWSAQSKKVDDRRVGIDAHRVEQIELAKKQDKDQQIQRDGAYKVRMPKESLPERFSATRVRFSKTATVKTAGKHMTRALCVNLTCNGRLVYEPGALFCRQCRLGARRVPLRSASV